MIRPFLLLWIRALSKMYQYRGGDYMDIHSGTETGGWKQITQNWIFFFWGRRGPHWVACGILNPQPGIKPTLPALEVQSSKWRVNHWIPREIPITGVVVFFLKSYYYLISNLRSLEPWSHKSVSGISLLVGLIKGNFKTVILEMRALIMTQRK